MVRRTGWAFAKGSKYKRYANRRLKIGEQYRDSHTGLVYDKNGRIIGYEPKYGHVSGNDKIVKKYLKKIRVFQKY